MRIGAFSKYALCALAAAGAGYFFGVQNPEPAPPSGNLTKAARRASGDMAGRPANPAAPSNKESAATAWAAAAAGVDPHAALTTRLEDAFRLGEPFSIALAIQLLGEMAPEDAPAVLELLKAHPEWSAAGSAHNPPPVWQAFWMSWGASDPEAALAKMESGVPAYPFNDRAEKDIFSGLALRDHEKAAALALTRTNEVSKKWAVEGTIYRWAGKDLDAATRWALTELDEPYQSWALKAVPWAVERDHGPAAALRWWQSLPAAEGTTTAFQSIVEISGRSGTTTADDRMALFTAGHTRGFRSHPLDLRIATDFVKTDPLAGLATFTSMPPGENGAYAAVALLINNWAASDPVAAGTWLQRQTSQPWATDAIKGYAGAIGKTDPDAAARWLSVIPQSSSQ